MQKSQREYYLYKSVQEDNILPLTSKCNLSCIFCSHNQNPPGVEIISMGDLSLDKAVELINFLNPDKPIVIGESATKIIEGEPLLHPKKIKILKAIRKKYENTEIKITTNGLLIDQEFINFIKNNKKITLNISVNYIEDSLRKEVMGKQVGPPILDIINEISQTGVDYHFSTVALPHLFGYKIIEKELIKMTEYNPLTIRVFMPGFTKYTSKKLKFDHRQVYDKLAAIIHHLNLLNETPIIIEPPRLKNLNKIIIGVIKQSPADIAGLKYLDEIVEVNNIVTTSKVETFNLIKSFKNPLLKLKRGHSEIKKVLNKGAGKSSGIIMNYDLSLDKINELDRLLSVNQNKRIIILSSELGYQFMKYMVRKYLGYQSKEKINIKGVKNIFMKGSIMSAGLITNYDIEYFLKNNIDFSFDLLILPAIMYDIFNNDLCGESYKKLERKFNIQVEIL
ncbi:MAG: DUF512 domain-containing protein [Halanaerobiales bacterium]|nr:DUF512 domain-containing protein [Halanaerobiales bacterium]